VKGCYKKLLLASDKLPGPDYGYVTTPTLQPVYGDQELLDIYASYPGLQSGLLRTYSMRCAASIWSPTSNSLQFYLAHLVGDWHDQSG
jgi:hypothetical protein